jgi:hypothetical protein
VLAAAGHRNEPQVANLRALAQALSQLVAVHVEQIHLQEHDIRTELDCECQGSVR